MCGGWHDSAFQCAIRQALAMGLGLKEINRQTADVAIQTALTDEGGNLRRAARRLGLTDRALQMRRASRRQEEERLRPGDNDEPYPFTDRGVIRVPTEPSKDH
jgi:hypothetical protein